MQRNCAKLFGMPIPPSDQSLAALAHPIRARLYAELRRLGTSTATELALLLDTNSGSTSYHLRRLADAGLVTDVSGGTGRQRRWRPQDRPRRWSQERYRDDVDAANALDWLERDYVWHFAQRADAWLDLAGDWPSGWRDALGMSEAGLLVTQDQLMRLRAELAELLARYRRVGQGNPTARRVAFYGYCFPVDPDRPPA